MWLSVFVLDSFLKKKNRTSGAPISRAAEIPIWEMTNATFIYPSVQERTRKFLDVSWKVYLASITVWQPFLSDHRLHTPSSLTNVGENWGEREHLAPLSLLSTQRWCFTLPSKNLCSTYSHTEVISCGLL